MIKKSTAVDGSRCDFFDRDSIADMFVSGMEMEE
jgi:hypothetical protein